MAAKINSSHHGTWEELAHRSWWYSGNNLQRVQNFIGQLNLSSFHWKILNPASAQERGGRGNFPFFFSFAFHKLILNYFWKCSHLHTCFTLPLNQSRNFFLPQSCCLMVDLCCLLGISSQTSSQVSIFSLSTLFCSEQLCLCMSLTLFAGIIVIILAVQWSNSSPKIRIRYMTVLHNYLTSLIKVLRICYKDMW